MPHECKELKPTIVNDYLVTVAKFTTGKRIKYSSFEEFILKNGKQFHFICPVKELGKLKECFTNAYHLAEKGFIYVEGYAISEKLVIEKLVIPLLHAWCIDKNDAVYDPTWKDGTDYFGIPFDINYVRKVILKRKRFGVINNMEDGFPLLTGKHKNFAFKEG